MPTTLDSDFVLKLRQRQNKNNNIEKTAVNNEHLLREKKETKTQVFFFLKISSQPHHSFLDSPRCSFISRSELGTKKDFFLSCKLLPRT